LRTLKGAATTTNLQNRVYRTASSGRHNRKRRGGGTQDPVYLPSHYA